jgi:hypothetical protein
MCLGACSPDVNLGNDVLWSTDHESGDLSDWSLAGGGGVLEQAPDATAVISQDFAHSGQWAARLTNQAMGTMKEAHLWRDGNFPQEAYYSAWYYLPQSVQTTVDWTIMQFRERTTSDPAVIALHYDIDLRSLPDGETILWFFDHDPVYLREPTPTPAIPVPIGAWFRLEVFYRHALDDTGRLTVWQDGVLVYDITGRSTGTNSNVYWTPCTVGYDTIPEAAVIYVDDAMISLRRRAGVTSMPAAD